jgi:hypothetical protein
LIFLTSELSLAAFVNNSGYTQGITNTACKAGIMVGGASSPFRAKDNAYRDSRKIAPRILRKEFYHGL